MAHCAEQLSIRNEDFVTKNITSVNDTSER